MSEQRCPQCENQCPVSDLGCGRGRRYFGVNDEGNDRPEGRHEHHGSHRGEPVEGAIGLLRQCGHMLHHGGAATLDALTAQEQAALEALLQKLVADWRRNEPKERRHGHGHNG